MSAFTLGDIASLALQKSTVEQLWAQTGDVLVNDMHKRYSRRFCIEVDHRF